MCLISLASLMLLITNDVFLQQKNPAIFHLLGLILKISGRSLKPSVKVMEQEQSVDDELPAEDSWANKLLIHLSYQVLY